AAINLVHVDAWLRGQISRSIPTLISLDMTVPFVDRCKLTLIQRYHRGAVTSSAPLIGRNRLAAAIQVFHFRM
ncbi:hypothetical protein, partial [Paracoccus sp. SSK6]|uniref:hypothetical protein n=1 Tax=Paracoccus sp. SSK6 TaxID=3143131 RepID=UPI00321A3F8E